MIRLATITDLDEIAHLYRDTISTVNLKDYSAEQVAAWAGRWTNTPGWTDKITNQHFLVVEDGEITGFSSLTHNGHVDMLFVHRNHQGKGVAKLLLTEIEQVAKNKKFSIITTDASITARPVFEHFGFNVVAPQTIMVDGVELNNFKMAKSLSV
ncbi:GNAT family N-acetyltransferase [Mucilaginibacter rigui]|uniref:GNAT family N-acetyltransferase n=1 Tax=Mucilaginibacter rigui TaxID=534635 RepID=A0ABR7X4M7_9SPHI|nr:GNAT family N-acetyltransferase [Mucilaginibacter rigui]MBD1385529.1 GNAT family N-acetyltransferase [Mucilaginibacter rigui]